MRRDCIHRTVGSIIRARVWRVSKYKSQAASKELPDYCPRCVDWSRYPRNTPGVLLDDKRTLFVPVPLLRRNNEAIYTNAPGAVPRWKLRRRLTGVAFCPRKCKLQLLSQRSVPTRLELINSPVLALHFVAIPRLLSVLTAQVTRLSLRRCFVRSSYSPTADLARATTAPGLAQTNHFDECEGLNVFRIRRTLLTPCYGGAFCACTKPHAWKPQHYFTKRRILATSAKSRATGGKRRPFIFLALGRTAKATLLVRISCSLFQEEKFLSWKQRRGATVLETPGKSSERYAPNSLDVCAR